MSNETKSGFETSFPLCDLPLNRFYAAIYFIIWYCLAVMWVMLLCLAARRIYWLISMLTSENGKELLLAASCKLPKTCELPKTRRQSVDEELSGDEQRLLPKKANPVTLEDLRLIILNRPLSDVFVYLMLASELNDPEAMNEIFTNLKAICMDAEKELDEF